jgi:membrane protein implicated in regulation of membrane protease activity
MEILQSEHVYLYWWMLAVCLLLLEFLAIGTIGSFFLWPAIAATLMGLMVRSYSIAPQHQILILATVSVLSVVLWRAYLRRKPLKSDQPFLNLRGAELVDQVYPVTDAIVDGLGRIDVADGSWRVEGPDCPVGTRVRVTDSGTARLQVELLDEGQDIVRMIGPATGRKKFSAAVRHEAKLESDY